ncbi:MAG: hypothetical protein WC975_15845, partial [Phycisphaerae bacterium]
DKPNHALLTIPPVMSDILLPDIIRNQKIAKSDPGVYDVPWQTSKILLCFYLLHSLLTPLTSCMRISKLL